MRTHVALLRGINVLGRNKVSMADLRQVVASHGHGDVASYIQSGNVLFTAAKPDANSTAVADDLEIAIADQLAVRPAVVVLALRELTQVVSDNPFCDEDDHRLLHAVFLREPPGANGVASVQAAVERARSKQSRDNARVVGRTLYLWTPDGFGRSILRLRAEPWRTAQDPDASGNGAELEDRQYPRVASGALNSGEPEAARSGLSWRIKVSYRSLRDCRRPLPNAGGDRRLQSAGRLWVRPPIRVRPRR